MISWLKYAPLKWRHASKQDTDAQGPSFSNAKLSTLLVDGTKISIKAPRNSWFGTTTQAFDTGNTDALDVDQFKPERPGVVATQNWLHQVILLRQWIYNGAWFTGDRGCLYLTITLQKRAPKKEFGGTGFLHTKSFEYAISNILDDRYGHYVDHNHQAEYLGPCNWQVRNNLAVPSVSFGIKHGAAPIDCFCFPVGNDLIATFEFTYTGSNFLRDDMGALANQIIDSVRLEPSPKLQAQLRQIEESEDGQPELSKTMAPFNWPIDVDTFEQTQPQSNHKKGLEKS